MKIVLVGANGTVGKAVSSALKDGGHEIVKVGRASGDFKVNIEDAAEVAALFKKIGTFDAVANASGEVTFAPLTHVTTEQWQSSFRSKFLGQINLVQQAISHLTARGSITLIAGVLGDEQIMAGTVAATVNYAIQGFVKAAACELPKNLRLNVVSPTVLEESMQVYGDFFPGFTPVAGARVGQAFKKSIFGVETGQVIKVY